MHNILILGSGGREHALAWKISQSDTCQKLYVAPGNGGTPSCAENVALDILDFAAVKSFAEENKIDFIVVGPEAPLVEGIFDYFIGSDITVIGPSKEASQLEGSKAYANAFMLENNIPTAAYVKITKDNIQEGFDYIDQQDSKIVLKADGLAAGKGVLIIDDKEEAKTELSNMLNGKFGAASEIVVIEEFLDGIEFSVFVFTDGKDYTILPVAKDYKRIGEGDTGLNTGGMGAVSPPPFVDSALMEKVTERIIKPTLVGLQNRQLSYHGFIFLGLILVNGDPYVIEYNCRMGDPETEAVLPRIQSDFVEMIALMKEGRLSEYDMQIDPRTMATVMLVSGGYPEAYEKNKAITIDGDIEDSIVFHAGTKKSEDGSLVTSGGRVIAVSSFGESHTEAVQKSMNSIQRIRFDKMNYRKDIGFDL